MVTLDGYEGMMTCEFDRDVLNLIVMSSLIDMPFFINAYGENDSLVVYPTWQRWID